jgi:O-antigen ligase
MALFQLLAGAGTVLWLSTAPWRSSIALLRSDRLTQAAVALWLWLALSATWAELPREALNEAWTYRKLLLVIPFRLLFDSERLRLQLLRALLGGWALCFGVGLLGHLAAWAGAPLPPALYKPHWGMLGINYIQIGVMQVTLAFALFAAARTQGGSKRAALLGLAVCAAADALFMWNGRLSLISFDIVAMLGMFVWQPQWRRLLLLLVLLAGVNWLVVTHSEAWSKRGPLLELEAFENTQRENSTTLRKNFWRCAIDIWQANPVAGAGAGARHHVQDSLCHFDSTEIADMARRATAHQQYLQFAAETGAIGLAMFLALNLLAIGTAWQDRQSFTGQVTLALLLVLACGAMFNSFLRDAREGHLWALAFAMASVRRRPGDVGPGA